MNLKLSLFLLISINAFGFDWSTTLAPSRAKGIEYGIEWNGPRPYKESNESLKIPASVMKIFTAISAYKTYGPDYRFKSVLDWNYLDLNNTAKITALTLHLNGDPSWAEPELGEDIFTRADKIASELKARGITEIVGELNLVADDIRWNSPQFPVGEIDRHKLQCFGSRAHAVTFQRNCAVYIINSLQSGHWFEYGVADPVEFRMVSGRRTSILISLNEKQNGYIISGTWAPRSVSRQVVLPVNNPILWLKNVLVKAIQNQGILFTKPSKFSDLKQLKSKTVSAIEIESQTLHSIVRLMLKNSVNILAHSLFVNIGIKQTTDPNLNVHEAAYKVILNQLLDLGISVDPNLFIMKDGSGLSYDDRANAALIYQVLDKIKTTDVMTYFWDALSIAGIDGTLKNRMIGTSAKGQLRAKTGTLDSAKNLAGYIPKLGLKGEILEFNPFVILANYPEKPGLMALAEGNQDLAGTALFDEVNLIKAKP